MRELLTEREIDFLFCFADCDMKTQKTALAMDCHKATVTRAFGVIYRKTGYDPTEFWDLYEILQQLGKEGINGRQVGREMEKPHRRVCRRA